MRTTEHVEQLLRQGHKPKELIELGFPKSVVTKVRRQLREGKATPRTKVPEGMAQAETHVQSPSQLPEKMAALWQKLQSMAGDLQKVDSLAEALSKVKALMAAAQELGSYRRENCPYQEDGVCIQRAWSSQDDIPQGIGEPVAEGNEKPEWYIKPSPFYCAMCTAVLGDRVGDIENEVSGNPLSGAKYRITCTGCGNKGYIATAIKCTKCGRITYWGWWPKKE